MGLWEAGRLERWNDGEVDVYVGAGDGAERFEGQENAMGDEWDVGVTGISGMVWLMKGVWSSGRWLFL